MTRLEKLEAVVEAARAFRDKIYHPLADHEWTQIKKRFYDALAALDAHTEAQEVTGETVDIRAVCLQAINDKLAAVPKPRSYEMAHYCMGLEDAAMAIQSKITVTLPLNREGGR